MDGSVDTARSENPVAALLGPGFVRKFFKYAMTSVVGVVVSQSSLLVFVHVLDWGGLQSNVASVALGTIPTYWMSRAWVWSKSGKSNFYAEVLPFWVLTFLGLVLSSLFVVFFEHNWPDNKLLINVGNIAGFGVLWIAKFFILDRLLFKVTHEHIETPTPVL